MYICDLTRIVQNKVIYENVTESNNMFDLGYYISISLVPRGINMFGGSGTAKLLEIEVFRIHSAFEKLMHEIPPSIIIWLCLLVLAETEVVKV